MSRNSRGEQQLGAAVLVTLMNDLENYEKVLETGIPKTTKHNRARIDGVIMSGCDAMYCLYISNPMLSHWAQLAGVYLPKFREECQKTYPLAFKERWGSL